MKRRLGLKIQFVLLLLLQTSCAVKTTVKVPESKRLLPAKTATRSELLQSLEEKSTQIETLKATVSLEYSRGAKSGVVDEYHETKGYVFVGRPTHVRIQVQLPIVLTTVAVVVSDGEQYRLWLPMKNQFAVEDEDAPVDPKNLFSSLRPKILRDGLFVDVRPYLEKASVKFFIEEAVVDLHSYYVFTFFDDAGPTVELLEKIWIDRTDLQVARKQVFDEDGRLETDVDYQDYHNEDGIPFPKVIVIHRPIEDYTLKMSFQQTTMNDKLDAKVFELPRPEGSELVQSTQ